MKYCLSSLHVSVIGPILAIFTLLPTTALAGFAAYVTNEFSNTVSVVKIGPTGEMVLTTIPVGQRPIGIIATPDGQKVYVGNSDGNSVSVISTASNTVIKTIDGIVCPMGEFASHPNGTRVYVGDCGSAVYEIDTATDTVVSTFWMGLHGPPVGLEMTSDGQYLFATSSWAPASGVAKIRLSDKAVVALQTAGPIVNSGPIGLALYAGDSRLLVASCGFSFDFNKDTCNGAGPVPLVELDASNLSVLRVLSEPAFGALNSISVTPDETRAYIVDSSHTDVIHIVDLVSFTRVGGVPLHSHPRAITVASFGPGADFLYAPDSDHGTLLKIDANPGSGTYNTVVGSTKLQTYPRGVAIGISHRPEAEIRALDTGSCPMQAEMHIFDDEGHALSGAVNLYRRSNPFPNGISEIRLEVLHTRCNAAETLQFIFGDMATGTVIDTFQEGVPQLGQPAPGFCTCTPGVETRVYSDPNILGLYDTSDDALPQFHLHRPTTINSFGTAFAWARVVLSGPDGTRSYCIFDFDGGDCSETDLCNARFTWGVFHADAFVEDAPVLVRQVSFTNSQLPSAVDLSALLPGSYTLELTATDGIAMSRDERVFDYDAVCRRLRINNRRPIASCGDRTVSTDNGQCSVDFASVDNGSFDPDGDPITSTQTPAGSYLLGTTAVTLRVTDDSGAFDSCAALVTVEDRETPVVRCAPGRNPSGGNEPPAQNEDGFYEVSSRDNCSVQSVSIGDYILGNGETIKITQSLAAAGVRLLEEMGPLRVKHFLVGPGDAVIVGRDGSGNAGSATCLVPPPPK